MNVFSPLLPLFKISDILYIRVSVCMCSKNKVNRATLFYLLFLAKEEYKELLSGRKKYIKRAI